MIEESKEELVEKKTDNVEDKPQGEQINKTNETI